MSLRDLLDDPEGIDKFTEMSDEGIRSLGIDVAADEGDETPLEEFEERT